MLQPLIKCRISDAFGLQKMLECISGSKCMVHSSAVQCVDCSLQTLLAQDYRKRNLLVS